MKSKVGRGRTEVIALLVAILVAVVSPVAVGAQELPPPAVFVVNSVGDQNDVAIDGTCATAGGECTLRAAVSEANAVTGRARVEFAIPGDVVHTIALQNSLVLDGSEVTIDGYTQPGSAVNTDPIAFNAVVRIELRGAGPAGFEGIRIASPGNTVRGLALYAFRQAIKLNTDNADANVVAGNIVGSNAAMTHLTTATQIGASGVFLQRGASSNDIGLPTLDGRNVIGGNGQHGIALYDQTTADNRIRNNIVGLAGNGTRGLPNRNHGIDVNFNSSTNIIGGLGVMERNVVSGNLVEGIELSHGPQLRGNQIVGNYVGTTLDGSGATTYTRNLSHGIHIEDGPTQNLVANNVVANNGQTFARAPTVEASRSARPRTSSTARRTTSCVTT